MINIELIGKVDSFASFVESFQLVISAVLEFVGEKVQPDDDGDELGMKQGAVGIIQHNMDTLMRWGRRHFMLRWGRDTDWQGFVLQEKWDRQLKFQISLAQFLFRARELVLKSLKEKDMLFSGWLVLVLLLCMYILTIRQKIDFTKPLLKSIEN